MLSGTRLRQLAGWLAWTICLCFVDGLIEIVEEHRCYDYEFRLICRELDSRIAVLEAWYTTLDDYNQTDTTPPPEMKIKTENDSELNRVYIYSSPKHNGVYAEANHSIFENITMDNSNVTSDSLFFNNTVESVEVYNANEDCGVRSFVRSYASFKDGDKRRPVESVERPSSFNLRAPISYRCTGVNHCSFVLKKDYAHPRRKPWAPGVVFIKYACFDDSDSIHYCNLAVNAGTSGPTSEGYIRTPGYPHYYVAGSCGWRVSVHAEQRVRVTLVDVSLRSIGPFEDKCTDSVLVTDSSGATLLSSSCDQVELPLRLISNTNVVDILVDAKSKNFYPSRGVLLHYKSIGCVTIPAPSDGYLVYRNEEVAHYMCNVNFVFDDTRQRARLLWCYDDNRWNDTVPLCVFEEAKPALANNSSPTSPDRDTKLPPTEANMIVDIVIPSLLIAALFIGNAFIVLIIYKYRKRKNDDLEDEFNTIPLSVNGNVHSAGNAV